MEFQSDSRIRSAAPDLLLEKQDVTNLLTPADIVTASAEQTDWGIADIEADKLWGLEGATDGMIFGVMDAGFARHQDLVFLEMRSETEVSSHGNHVWYQVFAW